MDLWTAIVLLAKELVSLASEVLKFVREHGARGRRAAPPDKRARGRRKK